MSDDVILLNFDKWSRSEHNCKFFNSAHKQKGYKNTVTSHLSAINLVSHVCYSTALCCMSLPLTPPPPKKIKIYVGLGSPDLDVVECWKPFNIPKLHNLQLTVNGCNQAWNGQCLLVKPMERMREWEFPDNWQWSETNCSGGQASGVK
jgi:hypothetical protein